MDGLQIVGLCVLPVPERFLASSQADQNQGVGRVLLLQTLQQVPCFFRPLKRNPGFGDAQLFQNVLGIGMCSGLVTCLRLGVAPGAVEKLAVPTRAWTARGSSFNAAPNACSAAEISQTFANAAGREG